MPLQILKVYSSYIKCPFFITLEASLRKRASGTESANNICHDQWGQVQPYLRGMARISLMRVRGGAGATFLVRGDGAVYIRIIV